MEERFRPLTFHGIILRSQLVNLLIRGVCYAENQSVSGPTPNPLDNRVVFISDGGEISIQESIAILFLHSIL